MEKHSTKHIQLLPEHIIDQIKAGEVIERPATLIKELLENSIDAQSTHISIHIVNNGMDLISVEDNGRGIDGKDLYLAFCRHATSKISNFEDIYNLYTYGFRGEALASMASISKITCNSTHQSKTGLIKIHGGEVITHQYDQNDQNDQNNQHDQNDGTSIYVKDLFYNTPARLKFIKSKTSEKNQLKKVLNAFLLTHPQVTFSIKWDEQDRQVYPAIEEDQLEKRIQKMFFKKHPISFETIKSEYDQIHFSCLLSNESSRGNAGKHQYLFVNKRFVQDIQIHKVILNSAAGLWRFGETGNYFAFIDLPADQLDVNVHPNKTVVKLYRASQVFSQISSSIKKIISKQQELMSTSIVSENSDLSHINSRNRDAIIARPSDFTAKSSSQDSNENISFSNLFSSSHSTRDSGSELSQKELSYKSTINNFQQGQMDEQQDYSIVFQNKRFAILTAFHMDLALLIDLKKLAWVCFSKLLSEQSSSIPLLVSEPLRNLSHNSINFLTQLNNYGFELDQLDQTTMVLRAYPQQLDGLAYLDFLIILIDSLELNESASESISEIIDRILKDRRSPAPNLSAHGIRKLIDKFNLVWLQEQKIALQLDNAKLEKVFYE